MNPQCPSIHRWSDQQCIRPVGHEGLCYGKACRGAHGTITRAYWYSRDGKFHCHYQYDTKYPTNAQGGAA